MSRRLTVFHSHPVWLGQTLTWLHTQVAGLQEAGVETHVVCERTENLDQFNVANLHCLSDSGWRRYWDIAVRRLHVRRHLDFLVRTAARHNARILHSHFGHFGWANCGAADALGVPHVVTFYGLDVNQLPLSQPKWRVRYRHLFHTAAAILCEGPHMAKCIEALGCPAHKLRVHRLGVKLEGLPYVPRQWDGKSPLRVLIAASFREKKGIPVAIEALGLVGAELPLEVTIIGDSGADRDSQREKRRIVDAVARSGLSDKIKFLGFRPHADMIKAAYQHHLFLSPSVTASNGDTEGGAPVSIIEMVATGMPVVSTHHCDIPDVIGPSAAHLLAPERNAGALADCIRRLASDTESWPALLAAGRSRVESRHDPAAQARALELIYRELVEDRP
jgi:colanic acid/amylovoran biosynthesis glycosyltransferase